jgi:outer membrane protein
MRRGFSLSCCFALGKLICAQNPATISLVQARDIAVKNHPRVASAALAAQASKSVVNEVRSAYYPVLSSNTTAVGTPERNGVLFAGAVTTSSIFDRVASGLVASQLLTDFGRTKSLEQSAQFSSASKDQDVVATRAQVLVEVTEAYYNALASEAVLKVAQATLDLRRVTLRQVTALAQSSMRSTLDVSFAEVNVSQAELDLVRAQDEAKASHARLSAAMGNGNDQPFSLSDEPLPAGLNPKVDSLISQAMQERPDLAALKLNQQSLERTAEAEKDLRNPTISAAAVAGVAAIKDDRLPQTYGAAGVNVSIPILNGGLFKARREEAETRAAAAAKDVQTLSVQIARDVRVTWLDANDAFQRLDVTARMVAEATEAVRLAQARYDAALGSIVELSQAQLNETSAEIAAATAKYEYLDRRAALDYAIGVLR